MSTVAKYLRISHEDIMKCGDEDSVSIVSQRHLLNNYLDTHGEFDGWERIELCDDGWTGTNFERPGMKQLLEMVRKGLVQCIIVKDLSRFGRDYLTVGDYISRVFPFMGVRFISLGDSYDSARPADIDSLSVTFSTIIYDMYSKELSEKVRASKDRMAENGDYFGPAAPFGYRKDSTQAKHLIIDPDAAEIVKQIFEMAGSGATTTVIARHLNETGTPTPMQYKRIIGCLWHPWQCISEDNIWTRTLVTKILRDERYLGQNIYGKRRRAAVGTTRTVKAARSDWIVVKGTHEALISEAQFKLAQDNLKEFREHTYCAAKKPLAYKVFCGSCGRAMMRSNAKAHYYYCDTPRVSDAFNCTKERVPESDIMDAICTTIRSYARLAVDLDAILAQQREKEKTDRKQTQRELMVLQSKKEQTEHRLQEIYESFIEGNIDKEMYVSRKQTLSNQLSKLMEKMGYLSATLSSCPDTDHSEIISKFRSYADIDSLAAENLRELLHRVTIFPDGVLQIRLNFAEELESLARSFSRI